MVETFTPAVCGSRKRQLLALAGFAGGAVTAAAALGAVLGLVGGALGAGGSVAVLAGLALLAAAREAGLVRVPLPQARRQVPERWRHELPLPLWSLGYGAGLGAGVATYQPVATFWVACAGAVVLARPLQSALCLSLYGAGRALMAALPRRGDPTAAVERLVNRRRLLQLANVVGLAVCAALLVAPGAGAATARVGPGLDPSASPGVLASARVDGGAPRVVVQPNGEAPLEYPDAFSPSVDGDLVAYAEANGIRVLNWRTGNELAHIPGAVSKPALDWPLVAYRRDDASYKRIVLSDFTNRAAPTERAIVALAAADDLGRPSLRAGRLAYARVTRTSSRIVVRNLRTGARSVVARSRIALLSNPSVTRWRTVWIDQRGGRSQVRMRHVRGRRAHVLMQVRSRYQGFWTTALTGRTAYVTRWTYSRRTSSLYRVSF